MNFKQKIRITNTETGETVWYKSCASEDEARDIYHALITLRQLETKTDFVEVGFVTNIEVVADYGSLWGYDFTDHDIQIIKGLVKHNEIVLAVKHVRKLTNSGLKDSKDWVDENFKQLR